MSVSATSSLWKEKNFINDSPRWLLSFCISLPNEFWELCAVVITTRCQLGNLYANGIGLGLISLPIPQDLVAMGMPNSSLSNFYFFFTFIFCTFLGGKDTAAFLWSGCTVTSPQMLRKGVEVWRRKCNLTGRVQLGFELVWSNELVLCCLTRLPADGHTAQRLRWSEKGVLDRVAWQPCTGTPPLSPSAEP